MLVGYAAIVGEKCEKFVKGLGIGILWQQFLALFLLGAVILGFAVNRFHKTL